MDQTMCQSRFKEKLLLFYLTYFIIYIFLLPTDQALVPFFLAEIFALSTVKKPLLKLLATVKIIVKTFSNDKGQRATTARPDPHSFLLTFHIYQ